MEGVLMKTEIAVGGIWLRGCGPEHIEVLAEVNGEWRVVIPSQHIETGHEAQTVSHCVHPSGIANSPKETL
jgi:hypothetical protein